MYVCVNVLCMTTVHEMSAHAFVDTLIFLVNKVMNDTYIIKI